MNLNRIHNDIHEGALQLMAEHRDQLFARARPLCDSDDEAEELVILTIDKAIRKIGTYTGDGDILSWMTTILVNLHTDEHRSRIVRCTEVVDPAKLEQYAGADWSTDEQILRNPDRDVLIEAIKQLDPEYRRLVALYYFNELTLREIAALLNSSTSSVSRKLEIARKILFAKLEKKLGKRPFAVLAALLSFAFLATAAVATGWFADGGDRGRGGNDGGTGVPPVQVANALSGQEANNETEQDAQQDTQQDTQQTTKQTTQLTIQEKETQDMNLPKVITAAALAVSAVAQNANAAAGVDLTLDRVQQRYPWNGFVDIDYTITRDTDALPDVDDNLEVLMIDKSVTPAVTNRAIRFLQAPLPLTAGKHRITWDANGDGVTNYSDKASFIVKIAHYAPAYMVIDVSKGKDAPVYPVTYLNGEPTGGFNTPEYKGDKIVLRRIHPGSYMAGSPTNEANRTDASERQHRVALTKPFYIGIFEITQKQYENVMGETSFTYEGDDRPADNLSYTLLRGKPNYSTHQYMWPWTDEVAPGTFLGILRAKCKAFSPDTNDYTEEVTGFDLPLEFQWEYACRAGTTGAFSTTDTYENTTDGQKAVMDSLGRHKDNKKDGHGDYFDAHTNVGRYAPNPWGLYDMHGNMYELCRDLYGGPDVAALEQYVDPEGAKGTLVDCVARGGAWMKVFSACRSASRTNAGVNTAGSGFRLSRTLP